MSTPTTQQQWDHAKFETLHAAYDAAPSPADADKLIKDCIEWAWNDHVEELAQEEAAQ